MDDDGWITVKHTSKPHVPKPTKPNKPNKPAATRSSDISYDGQDYKPIVFHKHSAPKRCGPKTLGARQSKTKGYESAIERKAQSGVYKTRKFDKEFIHRVQKLRRVLGFNQSSLDQVLFLPKNTINQLESGKLAYNPQLKNKLNNALIGRGI